MHGVSGSTNSNFHQVSLRPKSAERSELFCGRESGEVKKPFRYHDKGDICFNASLTPHREKAVVAVCKNYFPDIESEFYFQIQRAIEKNVKFVLCLVDVYKLHKGRAVQLIEFCKRNKIDIINFEYSQNRCLHRKTPEEIVRHFPKGTPTIFKETFSIFSSPETHEHLKRLSPDALIFSGEVCDCCIKASVLGIERESIYFDWYGQEFGATQYGFPVYLQENLVYDDNNSYKDFDHPLLYKFKSIAHNIR